MGTAVGRRRELELFAFISSCLRLSPLRYPSSALGVLSFINSYSSSARLFSSSLSACIILSMPPFPLLLLPGPFYPLLALGLSPTTTAKNTFIGDTLLYWQGLPHLFAIFCLGRGYNTHALSLVCVMWFTAFMSKGYTDLRAILSDEGG